MHLPVRAGTFSERPGVDPYISGMFEPFNYKLPHRKVYLRKQFRYVLVAPQAIWASRTFA